MTVTPAFAVHADAAAAPACGAGATTASIAIAAPSSAAGTERVGPVTSSGPCRRPDRQHCFNDTVTDAADDPTGSAWPAIAGTDCTVAKTFAVGLPGKTNAPKPLLVHPS